MFGILKMSGAPPKVFNYYRSSKDKQEKVILKDLYNSYDALIKLKDVQTKPSTNDRLRGEMILSSAFKDLYKFGIDKGYPEYLILLFYQF